MKRFPLPSVFGALLLVAVAVAANSRREQSPAPRQDECPGGVCPTEPRPLTHGEFAELQAWLRANPGSDPNDWPAKPIQADRPCPNPDCHCEDCDCDPCRCKAEPTVAIGKQLLLSVPPEPKPLQPLKVLDRDDVEPDEPRLPKIGPNGWRLRVLHPDGLGAKLRKLFRDDVQYRRMAERYGYDEIATSEPEFRAWRRFGFPADRTTIVLVDERNKVIFRADVDSGLNSVPGLYNAIADAAARHRSDIRQWRDWQPMWQPMQPTPQRGRFRW